MCNQAEEVFSDGLDVETSKKKMPCRVTLFRCRRYQVLSSGRKEISCSADEWRSPTERIHKCGWVEERTACKEKPHTAIRVRQNSFEKHFPKCLLCESCEKPNKQSPNQPANYLYTLKCPNKSTNFGQNKSNKLFCPKKTLISDKIRYHDTIKSRELPTPKGMSF